MSWDYLSLWPYAPDGFISSRDERTLQGATRRNIRQPALEYALYAVDNRLDQGDEVYGGNPYQYVPVVVQGWGAIEYSQHRWLDEPEPYQQHDPTLRQLAQNAYRSLDHTWRSIIGNNAQSDWDSPGGW